jgi:archaemetzincin
VPAVHILNHSSLPPKEFERVVHRVEQVIGSPVIASVLRLDVDRVYDSSRRQYNSTALLAQLLGLALPASDKRIAVVDVDLYIPILTFVFGEAQLDAQAAVVSSHRLSNLFYGLEEDRILVQNRLEKEIVHELCHTFGLHHCHQFECVMRSSTYVEEIDLKKIEPCPACRSVLTERVQLFSNPAGGTFRQPTSALF